MKQNLVYKGGGRRSGLNAGNTCAADDELMVDGGWWMDGWIYHICPMHSDFWGLRFGIFLLISLSP